MFSQGIRAADDSRPVDGDAFGGVPPPLSLYLSIIQSIHKINVASEVSRLGAHSAKPWMARGDPKGMGILLYPKVSELTELYPGS